MASVMRVTGAWTGLLSDWFDRRGFAAPTLRARLSRWAADDVVPLPVWREALAAGLALAGEEPAPELEVGACVQPAHVGVLGYLVLATSTLGEALLAYQRYEKLFYGVDLAEVVGLGDEVEIRWARARAELGQQGDGVAIAALVTLLRKQVAEPLAPTLVSFAHPLTGPSLAAYQRFFDCPVQPADSHIRVRFPIRYLGIAMLHADPGLKALLDRQASALLRALPQSDQFDRAAQQVLLRLLADGEPTLARAASLMHLAPRTLQRRLARHGLSWQDWLDRNREQLARQYLADRGLGLTDIALLLGYAEQSVFTRAFHRWTGVTPGRFRRALPGN